MCLVVFTVVISVYKLENTENRHGHKEHGKCLCRTCNDFRPVALSGHAHTPPRGSRIEPKRKYARARALNEQVSAHTNRRDRFVRYVYGRTEVRSSASKTNQIRQKASAAVRIAKENYRLTFAATRYPGTMDERDETTWRQMEERAQQEEMTEKEMEERGKIANKPQNELLLRHNYALNGTVYIELHSAQTCRPTTKKKSSA